MYVIELNLLNDKSCPLIYNVQCTGCASQNIYISLIIRLVSKFSALDDIFKEQLLQLWSGPVSSLCTTLGTAVYLTHCPKNNPNL